MSERASPRESPASASPPLPRTEPNGYNARRARWKIGGMLAVLVAIIMMVAAPVVVQYTASAPIGLWIIDKEGAKGPLLNQGDFVAACAPVRTDLLPIGLPAITAAVRGCMPVLKKIWRDERDGCGPPPEANAARDGISDPCSDGVLRVGDNRLLLAFSLVDRPPDGYGVWLVGDNGENSFDSRHFGALDPLAISGTARPFLTWGKTDDG